MIHDFNAIAMQSAIPPFTLFSKCMSELPFNFSVTHLPAMKFLTPTTNLHLRVDVFLPTNLHFSIFYLRLQNKLRKMFVFGSYLFRAVQPFPILIKVGGKDGVWHTKYTGRAPSQILPHPPFLHHPLKIFASLTTPPPGSQQHHDR